jgi:hypothetical protein
LFRYPPSIKDVKELTDIPFRVKFIMPAQLESRPDPVVAGVHAAAAGRLNGETGKV